MFYMHNRVMRGVAIFLVFYLMLSPMPWRFLKSFYTFQAFEGVAFGAQQKNPEAEEMFKDAEQFFREVARVEKPSFWQRHKYKIIVAGIIVGTIVVVTTGGTAAAPALAGVTGAHGIAGAVGAMSATGAALVVGFGPAIASFVAKGYDENNPVVRL